MFNLSITGDNEVRNNLSNFGNKIDNNLMSEMELLGLTMENEAKRSRPWTDRTGNARRSIRGAARRIGKDDLQVVLAIGVDYGVYLELSNGGRYRIIRPTIDSHRKNFIDALRRAFG